MSEPESTHEDPRKTRLIKYLLIAGAIAALPVYYITVNAIARSDYESAKAEWNAADTPFKFGDKLTGQPAVPAGQNLLESGFFAEFRVIYSTTGAPLPAFEAWGYQLRPAAPSFLQFTGGKFDGAGLFTGLKGKPALLIDQPGKSLAELIRVALEREFPDLAELPDLWRRRPEVALGFMYPSVDNAYSATVVSNKRVRDAHTILVAYADASLRTAQAESAKAALGIALRYDEMLTREPTLIQRMLGVVMMKQTLHAIYTALELHGFRDAEWVRFDAELAKVRCLIGLRKALAEEAMIWPAVVEKHGPLYGISWVKVLNQLTELKTEGLTEHLATLIAPEGWFIEDFAYDLRRQLAVQTKVISPEGRFSLSDCNDLSLENKSRPDLPWYRCSNGTLHHRKFALDAASTDTAVRCARLAIALERHRLRHGGFPETLAGLDLDLLPDGKIPVGVVFGLPPEYTLTPGGGYSLVYKNEDAVDASICKESTTARDIIWTIAPAPAKP